MPTGEGKPSGGPGFLDFALYILFYLGILLWVHATLDHPEDVEVVEKAVGTFFIVAHFLHALCFGTTSGALRNVMSEHDFRDYLSRLKKAQPTVTFFVECYHWEEEEEAGQEGRQQSQGAKRTSRKRVVTHQASRNYPIEGFLDETLSPDETMAMFHLLHDGLRDSERGDLAALEPLVEAHARAGQPAGGPPGTSLFLLCSFPLEFLPASMACQADFDRVRDSFFAANRRDEHQQHSTLFSCEGHREQALVTLRSGTDASYERPCWMSFPLFLILTLAGLSLPYSCFFFSKCTSVDWTVLKHFSNLPMRAWPDPVPIHSRTRLPNAAGKLEQRGPRQASASSSSGPPLRDDPRNRAKIDIKEVTPSYWSLRGLSGHESNKVRLDKDQLHHFQALLDATFVRKATRDRAGGKLPKCLKVHSVLRLELPSLWKRYLARQQHFEKTIGRPTLVCDLPGVDEIKTSQLEGGLFSSSSLMAPGLNEAYLFHGSSPSGALGISEKGFSLLQAGSKTGSMFGRGAYFAECSSKGDEYAEEERSGAFSGKLALLLCRVTLGRPFYTLEPDSERIEQALNSGRYQSVLGDRALAVGTYREFVVFEEDQIYPEYVIIYEREFA